MIVDGRIQTAHEMLALPKLNSLVTVEEPSLNLTCLVPGIKIEGPIESVLVDSGRICTEFTFFPPPLSLLP